MPQRSTSPTPPAESGASALSRSRVQAATSCCYPRKRDCCPCVVTPTCSGRYQSGVTRAKHHCVPADPAALRRSIQLTHYQRACDLYLAPRSRTRCDSDSTDSRGKPGWHPRLARVHPIQAPTCGRSRLRRGRDQGHHQAGPRGLGIFTSKRFPACKFRDVTHRPPPVTC